MDLLLGQLIYTSFPGIGFKTLVSGQVPTEILQAFIQDVATQRWDSYNVLGSEYRAVYLHQVTPECTLFGWLYNDGPDEMGRTHVPYFICYYLAEPLYAFQLENIFNCLRNGPVVLINRHSVPASLETTVLPNLWSYQPVRPGVIVPLSVRQHSQIALQQGELLDLFVSWDDQEMVINLNDQTYEQQIANHSVYTRYIVEGIEVDTAALDVKPIEVRIAAQQPIAAQPLEKVTRKVKSNEIYNHPRTRILPRFRSTEQTKTGLENSANQDLVLAYRNSQLLLKAGIAATALALFSSVYGLVQTMIFVPSNPIISVPSSRVFYKTLAEVPKVPQGLFNYGGATTFAPLRSEAIVSAINRVHPKFQLHFTPPIGGKPGSGTGIKMLLSDELSFAQSSRPLKPLEFDQAKGLGFTLEQVPVAIDGIAFYVNPLVSLAGLSLSQVRDIFTGKITNWKTVGGPALPITLFSLDLQSSGTAEVLKEKVLAGEEFSPTVQEVESTTESIRQVAKTPGGIGFATASEVIGQKTIRPLPLSTVHLLPLSTGTAQAFVSPSRSVDKPEVNKIAFANGSYPLTRKLFVIIKRDGRLDEQAGSAYANLLLTDEGQQLVEQAGFAPIRGDKSQGSP